MSQISLIEGQILQNSPSLRENFDKNRPSLRDISYLCHHKNKETGNDRQYTI